MRPYLAVLPCSILVLCGSLAHGTTLTVLDTDPGETLSFLIDGKPCQPLGTPGAPCTTGIFGSGADITFVGERAVTRIFTSLPSTSDTGTFAVVLTEPGTNVVSDIIEAIVASPVLLTRQTFFTFVSDPVTPADFDNVTNALVAMGKTTAETGAPVDITNLFRDATGALKSIPGDLSFVAASDIDVPESSSWLLLAVGLATLVGIARLLRT
jgi:hypothetical protein